MSVLMKELPIKTESKQNKYVIMFWNKYVQKTPCQTKWFTECAGKGMKTNLKPETVVPMITSIS